MRFSQAFKQYYFFPFRCQYSRREPGGWGDGGVGKVCIAREGMVRCAGAWLNLALRLRSSLLLWHWDGIFVVYCFCTVLVFD